MAAKGNGTTALARMLYLYRTVERLSLRDVAAQIGIGHATLMRIEHGHAMDTDTWLVLQAWLLNRTGDPPRQRKD